jgi:hypothetical protein
MHTLNLSLLTHHTLMHKLIEIIFKPMPPETFLDPMIGRKNTRIAPKGIFVHHTDQFGA